MFQFTFGRKSLVCSKFKFLDFDHTLQKNPCDSEKIQFLESIVPFSESQRYQVPYNLSYCLLVYQYTQSVKIDFSQFLSFYYHADYISCKGVLLNLRIGSQIYIEFNIQYRLNNQVAYQEIDIMSFLGIHPYRSKQIFKQKSFV